MFYLIEDICYINKDEISIGLLKLEVFIIFNPSFTHKKAILWLIIDY